LTDKEREIQRLEADVATVKTELTDSKAKLAALSLEKSRAEKESLKGLPTTTMTDIYLTTTATTFPATSRPILFSATTRPATQPVTQPTTQTGDSK
jgi:hypothetical protein